MLQKASRWRAADKTCHAVQPYSCTGTAVGPLDLASIEKGGIEWHEVGNEVLMGFKSCNFVQGELNR